jgi:hypothetical protein
VAALPKPSLFGVVLQDGVPIAYLEDPVTKRVARYRVGDTVAGGTVKTIESDTVQLSRPDGQITVRLHDPSRPRAAVPPTPGAPQGTPAAGAPPGVPTGVQSTFPGGTGPLGRRSLPAAPGRIPPQPADAQPPR